MTTLRLRSLRPVGSAILNAATAKSEVYGSLSDGYAQVLTQSGTAALAQSLLLARTKSDATQPEVILPGYGCPDLVAAAMFAGVKPVLADTRPDSPLFELTSLAERITSQTVAIVAPTFLGIRQRITEIRKLIADRNIPLIEDSAQWFPRSSQQRFLGDMVILSFGRGKPVAVLGGGALLLSYEDRTLIRALPREKVSRLKDLVNVLAYNVAIRPLVYGITQRLPFLGVGATKLKPLTRINNMSIHAVGRLAPNIRAYQGRPLTVQNLWREALAAQNHSSVVDLPTSHHVPLDHAMLRYPLLVGSAKERTRLLDTLQSRGLGVSGMYMIPLRLIPGIPSHLINSRTPGADEFASRLLTLPTHEDVDMQTIATVINAIGK